MFQKHEKIKYANLLNEIYESLESHKMVENEKSLEMSHENKLKLLIYARQLLRIAENSKRSIGSSDLSSFFLTIKFKINLCAMRVLIVLIQVIIISFISVSIC